MLTSISWQIRGEMRRAYIANYEEVQIIKKLIKHIHINVLMVCQCRFINGNKCTTPKREVENGKRYACVEAGSL